MKKRVDKLKNGDEGIITHWVNQPQYIGNKIKKINGELIMTENSGHETKCIDVRFTHLCTVKLIDKK